MAGDNELEFGIALPQVFVEDAIDPEAISQFAARAETLGYAGLWTQDQVVGSAQVLETLSLLCFVAATTRSVRLGVSVIVLPHRDPVSLAKQLSTLDQLSLGRLDVGLGLGNPNPHQRAFGITGEVRGERLRRFREGLATMKALWREGKATSHDTLWPLDETPMAPKPMQRPYPRLWFGGRHPNAMGRAIREADGWMGAGSSTMDEFVEQSALIREQLAASDRDIGSFRIAKRLYLAIDDDETRAEQRLRRWFDAYYGNADLANRVCVWGSRDKVLERIARVTEAGAEMVLLNPLFDYPMHMEVLADALIDTSP
jgi:alkanesulfonate monooxygenase SsuD/methylene tetrahydromethanopterin reductase-like flavin-dependent oxidoreductase (luciferase family)